MKSTRPYSMQVMSRTLLAVAIATNAASAQRPVPSKGASTQSASCQFKATDAWVTRQAAFFDDAGKKWTDDSLRVALLNAAGLVAPLKMPASYGVQIDGVTPP